jgi:hypothetical protein
VISGHAANGQRISLERRCGSHGLQRNRQRMSEVGMLPRSGNSGRRTSDLVPAPPRRGRPSRSSHACARKLPSPDDATPRQSCASRPLHRSSNFAAMACVRHVALGIRLLTDSTAQMIVEGGGPIRVRAVTFPPQRSRRLTSRRIVRDDRTHKPTLTVTTTGSAASATIHSSDVR